MSTQASAPALHRLIDALAEIAVADYLAAQAAPDAASAAARTNPAPLPDFDTAA